MIYSTRGIVLRTIKYGETSVIVSIFTELSGIQSYLVNGIRTSGKASFKASLFQPSAILDMEVYHNEFKNLQRIKEYKWGYLYTSVLSDVTKNAVGVYMVELLQKCLKQPERNSALYHFTEEAFLHLDVASESVTANFPLYFSLRLVHFFGFGIHDNYSKERSVLDLREGMFITVVPTHSYFLDVTNSYYISQFLKATKYADLSAIKLNKTSRREMLVAIQIFYSLHFEDFGVMKTLPILHEILS